MTKGFVVASLAGMLTIAVTGGLLYGVVFAGFFRANIIDLHSMKSPPALGWVALSHVPFGILLALVVRWRGELSARGGAIAGAALGFLMAMSYNLALYGTVHHWTLQLTLVEPFITMVTVCAAGAVVGLVLGREAGMNTRQRDAFDQEIARARQLGAAGDLERAFRHLERAHVIGQAHVGLHARAHWLMFMLELRRRRIGAACGQAVRIVLGVMGSAVGVVPVGNTGGTDISMFKRLPIPPDLRTIIDGGSSTGPEES